MNLSALTIRPAIEADEAAVRDCAEQAYARYTALIGRTPAPMTADFGAQISAGDVHIACDADGRFLGYIVFYPDERGMHIDSVAVLPNAAGRGIGRGLIRFCEDQARRQNAGLVHLYTNEKMLDNVKMYAHLGYIETARRAKDGFCRVFFEKEI